jgi:hypothetical protein
MSDKHKEVSGGKWHKQDAEFYTVLGWLAAMAVSIAGWAYNA